MINRTSCTEVAFCSRLKRLLPFYLLVVLILGVSTFLFHDRLLELLFTTFTKEDTVYAVDYSEKKFDTIRKNMSDREVISLLGNPLDKKKLPEDKKEIWYYSRAGKKYDNYFVRLVYFDESKHVIKTVKEYYLD